MASARARRGALVTIGLLIAISISVLVARRGDDTRSARETSGGSATERAKTSPHAIDPITGVPRWFGQRGAAARRIAGIVLLDGAPVPGAMVRLASKVTAAGLGAEARVVADGSGRFDLGRQPAGAYLIVAEMPRLTSAIESIDLRDPTRPVDQLRLALHACDASIHGTIRDSAGGVIPKARVVLGDGRLTTGAGAEADDAGTYELCVPVGGVGVVVKADGYGDLLEGINAFGRMLRDFSLLPEATVDGRVVREDDQAPIAGAIVELHSDDPQYGRRVPSLTTSSDAEGRFHFSGAAPGRHVVTAAAEGLATRRPVDVILEVGQPQDQVVCALAPTFAITGTVVEQGSRAPLAGVAIGMVQRTTRDPRRRLEAVTQPDGSFVIDHVFPGDYEPYVQNYRLATTPRLKVTVTSADANLTVEVERLASISGRVLRGGKPVDGARLNASQSTYAQSEHDGTYTLRGLEPGTFQIYAESKRIGAFTNGPKVTVAKGEQKIGVDVEMELSASIAGVVVDQNDAPVAGVSVSLTLLRGRDFGTATTADDGTFSARALSGGGEYAYEVRQGDGSSLSYPPATGRRHPPIMVRDGQSQITGVRIKIRRERLSIAGRVLDAAGAPVADVAVTAMPVGGYSRSPSAATDETGAFTIHDLPAGAYSVHARAARNDQHEENVAAGRTDLVLRLPGVGGIDGTLAGFTVGPEIVARRVNGGGTRHRATITGETFVLRDLPAGTYQVVATSSSGIDFTSVEVPPAAMAKLALRQRGFGTIAGTVVDEATRAPIAGLRCHLFTEAERFGHDRPNADVGISDSKGAYRFDRVLAGTASVTCANDTTHAGGESEVSSGQTTRLDLTARTAKITKRAHIGLEVEVQLGETMVKAVETGGAAARAGLVVGDVILLINNRAISPWGAQDLVSDIEDGSMGKQLTFSIERADKPMTVLLTVEPAP